MLVKGFGSEWLRPSNVNGIGSLWNSSLDSSNGYWPGMNYINADFMWPYSHNRTPHAGYRRQYTPHWDFSQYKDRLGCQCDDCVDMMSSDSDLEEDYDSEDNGHDFDSRIEEDRKPKSSYTDKERNIHSKVRNIPVEVLGVNHKVTKQNQQNSNDNLAIVEGSGDTHLPAQLWIPSLHLTLADKKQLLDGEMLTDKHIWAAQKLIKEKYPYLEGLQDPVLSQTNSFECCHFEGLQIHYTGSLHWVTSASVGDCISLYDSMNGSMSADLKRQLLKVYKSNMDGNGILTVHIQPVPLQQGTLDCGLFAIANAVEIAEGNQPQTVVYNQQKMRHHLMRCFEDREISTFPKSDTIVQPKCHIEDVVVIAD